MVPVVPGESLRSLMCRLMLHFNWTVDAQRCKISDETFETTVVKAVPLYDGEQLNGNYNKSYWDSYFKIREVISGISWQNDPTETMRDLTFNETKMKISPMPN